VVKEVTATQIIRAK